jgi:hypothetical protein
MHIDPERISPTPAFLVAMLILAAATTAAVVLVVPPYTRVPAPPDANVSTDAARRGGGPDAADDPRSASPGRDGERIPSSESSADAPPTDRAPEAKHAGAGTPGDAARTPKDVVAGGKPATNDPDAADPGASRPSRAILPPGQRSKPPLPAGEAPSTRESPGANAEAHPLGPAWSLGRVIASPSVLGFQSREEGAWRGGAAAPLGQRYVMATMRVSHAGVGEGVFLVSGGSETSATVVAEAGDTVLQPLGALTARSVPWSPFDTKPLRFDGRTEQTVTLAFLIPEEVAALKVKCDAAETQSFTLSPEERLDVSRLIGYWRLAPGWVTGVRWDEPMADMLSHTPAGMIRFARSADGVRLETPSGDVRGAPLTTSGSVSHGWMEIVAGEVRTRAALRLTQSGNLLLMYLGEASGSVLAWERAE